MLSLLLRVFIAGAAIVAVTEIARLWPRLAAILLFVPIAIPVIFVAMYAREPNLGAIARLSRQAMVLIPLSLPLFLPMAFAERLQLSFWTALAVGVAGVVGSVGAYLLIASSAGS